MSDTETSAESLWYRLGFAFENTRRDGPSSQLQGLAARMGSRRRTAGRKDDASRAPSPGTAVALRDGGTPGREEAIEALIAAGAGTLVARILGVWKPRRQPGVLGLVRGAAAGAGAAFLRKLVHPLLHGEARTAELDDTLVQALLAGAARGLLYASIVEPRLSGPALGRGAVYGAAEYLVSPWGGLMGLMGKHAPHRRLPLLAGLFEEYEEEEDTLVDHIAFAVALAVLYGSGGDDDDLVVRLDDDG